jgi:hypothetical protein
MELSTVGQEGETELPLRYKIYHPHDDDGIIDRTNK